MVAPDDPGLYEAARKEASGSFLQKLFGKKSTTVPAPVLTLSAGERSETDIDKAWHGIHYLLTSSEGPGSPPLDFIVAGGEEVGDIEVGVSRARVFRAAAVREIHEALAAIDGSVLKSRFDPEAMMELGIYPEIWDSDSKEDDSLEYCLENFAVLKAFVADATDKRLGLVVTLG
jgi:uncharacterized protein DUF1877